MSIKFTDTQLLALSAAAQRQDLCIAAPPKLKGAVAQKFAARLAAAGLVKEVKAKPGSHVWRRDDLTGQAYALGLTPAGLKAVKVEETEAVDATAKISPTAPGAPLKEMAPGNLGPPMAIAAPREGTKLAEAIGLLRREGGATIDQLARAMGWLPHTTRAALTGLRKRGFGIDRHEAGNSRAASYIIADSPRAVER